MNFIQELKKRGMLHDSTPGVEAALSEPGKRGYIGFDPTAPSLTIGNYVQIMLLRLFQLSGHTPIILMGGATGRIGDPSGKDKERELKSYDELDHNLAFQQKQFGKFLDFEGENAAVVVNNYDFYKNMNVLDFLRDVGKSMNVGPMIKKTSVKKRIETGLSFTEFSYQMLQGYDFQHLYENHGCIVQMGGSDQWGNIVAGTEFIRKNVEDGNAYAVTTPLLTKADGSKFGKSEAGNIWLDPEMTTPYQFYQFWINADDRDLEKFINYFTLKPWDEVEALKAENAENPQALKRILAEELTRRVHSDEAYESVLKVTNLLFNKKANRDNLLEMSERDLKTVAGEIKTFAVKKEEVTKGVSIIDLLTDATGGMLPSKGDARRAIKGNAISVNKEKISSHETIINSEALLHGKYMMVENGKKNKFLVIAE